MNTRSPSAGGRRTSTAAETMKAIQRGEVDAIVVTEKTGARIYALHPLNLPYPDVLEALTDSAVVLDEQARIVYCNEAFCQLTGRRPSELEDTPLREWVEPADHAAFDALVTAGRPVPATEVMMRGARGAVRVQMALSPLPSEYFPVEDRAAEPEPGLGGFVVIIRQDTEAGAATRRDRLAAQVQDLAYEIVAARQEERADDAGELPRLMAAATGVQLDLAWIEERLRWMEPRPHSSVFARLQAARDQLGVLAARGRRYAARTGQPTE